MSNFIPANSAIPLASIKVKTSEIRDSISRISTGLRVLGGNDAGSQAVANTLNARAASFEAASRNNQTGIDLLSFVESALIEMSNLATRLKEVGEADTLSTNDTNDTTALNAEATYLSDTIDSIVSSLTYNSISVLGTSAKTFNIGYNDSGDTHSIKTTTGITATNISDATNADTSADVTIGEITQSLGNVQGNFQALEGFRNVSSSSAAHLLQAATNLQNTEFALETARLTKNAIVKNYALAMVAQVNDQELDQLRILA